MELKKNKKSIILVIALIIVITGTIVKLVKGMNYELNWKKSVSINLSTDNEIAKKDIEEIVKETFTGRKFKVQFLDEDEKEILITLDTAEITEEEQNAFVEKINTRYEEDLSKYDLELIDNDQIKLIDVLKPYILPIVISLIIIAVYFAIRYKALGLAKTIEYLIEGIVLPEWIYFSIFAIFRLPVGIYTVPVSMLVFLISIIALIVIFDKQYKKVSLKNNKKRK